MKNKPKNKSLKYFNFVLAVLMLVVVSLNIEQIMHNQRIFKPDNFKVFKLAVAHDNVSGVEAIEDVESPVLANCRECQKGALKLLNRLNGLGAILATLLATYSFLFAFNVEIFNKRFVMLVPGCIIVCIITFIYFIWVVVAKIPLACKNATILKESLDCDVDLKYNMDSKVIPLSVLMLVTVPQLLFRAILRVIFRCKHYRVHLRSPKIISPWTKRNHTRIMCSNAWKDLAKEDSHMEVREISEVVLGDRELPVDCGNMTETNNTPLINRNNLHLENMTHNFWIFTPSNNQCVETDAEPIIAASRLGNRYNYVHTSLSTISEEQSLPTSSLDEEERHKSSRINFIETLLNDIQTNSVLLNEIMCVFRPSSKSGTFTRNVPIRLTSSQKSPKKDNDGKLTKLESDRTAMFSSSESLTCSTPSIPSTTKQNAAIAKFENLPNPEADTTVVSSISHQQRLNHQKMLLAKKIRFVKRLKNCIETKRGNKFNYLIQIPYLSNNLYSARHENNAFMMLKSPSCKAIDMRQHKIEAERIQLDTSVQPVFF